VAVLCLAVALDLLLGDPPNRYHPVAWIGKLIALGRRLSARVPRELLVLYGVLLITVVTTSAVTAALAVQAVVGRLPWPLDLVGQAWLLKCSFSIRGLVTAVWRVRDGLEARDLSAARAAVGRDLVSRPVDDLNEAETASAAVESLAENLTDSWVAPLCFYLVAGVAGAWAYRAVNTADAMIGYREGALEQLGGASARLDDLLNLVPSRLAALALVTGARIGGESGPSAWTVWRRDGGATSSPNAGQTMAAMAGALGVTLEKRGHYRLGDGPPPGVAVLDRAVGVFSVAAAVALTATLVLLRAFR
jgi:adenosylcobinamide-phosphate synthase